MRCGRPRRIASVAVLGSMLACSGPQEGYYAPCDEPAGRVLGCDDPLFSDELTAWGACQKLVRCGVILADADPANPGEPHPFDVCVAAMEDTLDAQGDTVLACIEETTCPDLAQIDPARVEGTDPNPSQGNIEGVLGFCGRLDP